MSQFDDLFGISGLPTEDIKLPEGVTASANGRGGQVSIRSIDATNTTPCLLIAELNGKEVGRMSITAMPLVHDMEIPPSPIARRIADAMFHYACGKVKAAGFTEAVVIVENGNDRMHTYVKDRGAVEEPPSTVFMMEVK